MKKLKKPLLLFLCVIMILSSCFIIAYAKVSTGENDTKENSQTGETVTQEENPQEQPADVTVKVCADKGNWQNAPENSLKAINDCSCDYVSVDVKVTADGIPVLMCDETVDRTCVDENGNPVSGKVSDLKADEIKKFFLRDKNGGPHNSVTTEKVPLLSDVLTDSAKTFILDFKLENLDTVYDTVKTYGPFSNVIFRIDGKTKDIVDALAAKESVPEIILKYDGNIIFGVNKAVKSAVESGLHMVQLGSKNQYGVIFYGNIENKIRSNNLKAAFSMTDGYNAKRGDNINGWDDVISHGYSIIETDYPELLTCYVQECDVLRGRISELVSKKNEYSEGKYPKNLVENYNIALKDASELSEKTASKGQLAKAYTDLNNAMNALNLAEGTTTQQEVFNFSAGRIIAAVLCLAAVVAAQIYFVKRRKK